MSPSLEALSLVSPLVGSLVIDTVGQLRYDVCTSEVARPGILLGRRNSTGEPGMQVALDRHPTRTRVNAKGLGSDPESNRMKYIIRTCILLMEIGVLLWPK